MKRFQPEFDRKALRDRAEREVRRVLDGLPEELRRRMDEVPIVLEDRPGPDVVAQGMGHLLGLFTGVSFPDAISISQQRPPEILLFLEAILAEARGDPHRFREEVRRTLLHEIGHYLGLDERDLAERNLD